MRDAALRACFAMLSILAGCADESVPAPQAPAPGPSGNPDEFISPPPPSCAYECETLATCPEVNTPYACPTLGDWKAIPHAETCGAWDGTFPAVQPGACTASAPTGEAAKRAGPDPDDPTGHVLPDGRRIHPGGKQWVLSDVKGGLTSAVVAAPGTPFVVTVDNGYGDHAVHAVDTTLLAAGTDPVASHVDFVAPETLGSGIVVTAPSPPGGPLRVFVAGAGGIVFALTLDAATGALARDDAAALSLPAGAKDAAYDAEGLAASPDGKFLVVTGVDDPRLLTISIEPGASYGTLLGTLKLASTSTFGAWFDPLDPGSVYVSMWSEKNVVAVDVTDPAAPAFKTSYATDKNPEGIAFLDARWLAVANANGDSVSVVDRTSGEVASVPIDAPARARHGAEPSAVAWDGAHERLYVALSGDNAVAAYDVDLASMPPTLAPAGRVGAAWWPSGLAVLADGSLVVTNLRGQGGGPIPEPFDFGDNDIGLRMAGSIQRVPFPTAAELTQGAERVSADNLVAAQPGAPVVSCPAGADDFPVPLTNDAGPSSRIDHVFFILRENKNFDSLLGDLAGVDGEPKYTLKATTEDMDALWLNFRQAARAFSVSDDYYTDAVFSTQGHVWATYGRSSDFNERTWAISANRDGSPFGVPGGGVIAVGQPIEGSLFDWLYQNQVPFDILGEIDGAPNIPEGEKQPLDFKYPGVAQAIDLNDLPKACYASGRVRVTCDLGNFVYQTLPNDHTLGVSSNKPTPETYCAVNDEATGMMLHAISHSPLWKSSIVFITEDDPSSGGEHVDGHRTPLVIASPWVKRGYVSKTHIDIASIHKLYAHLFGLPYPNRLVEAAMLPLDLFTSTPDYSPFEYEHRKWPLACGMDKSSAKSTTLPGQVPRAEEELTELWDFSEEDRQPGLGAQVWRAMRGRPVVELTAETRGRLARWRR